MLVTSKEYVAKSHQPSTHSNAQNRRCTENEVGRVMKLFCSCLAQRQDQLWTIINSNLHTITKVRLIYTLCPWQCQGVPRQECIPRCPLLSKRIRKSIGTLTPPSWQVTEHALPMKGQFFWSNFGPHGDDRLYHPTLLTWMYSTDQC